VLSVQQAVLKRQAKLHVIVSAYAKFEELKS
jgi:hypothetical protein